MLEAFNNVKRERYLPKIYAKDAYLNSALPIGFGQTVSQPTTIAFMLSLLEISPEDILTSEKKHFKILEVGSGSGYVLALLDQILDNAEIYGAERIKTLYLLSKEKFQKKKNIHICYTPKGVGLDAFKPFDRILVSASAKAIPENLLADLDTKGVLVCPVDDSVLKIKKNKKKIKKEKYNGFAFVPLLG